ncbi:MAG: hypothetical protein R2827_07405 [Bdellovibrionales bacterium]
MKFLIALSFICFSLFAEARSQIATNAVFIHNSPKWLTRNRAEKVIDRIQSELEWTIRRVNVYFYDTEEAFKSAQSLGAIPRAVSVKSKKEQVVHLSPRVNDKNFNQVFAHELVHIVFFQKYKGAIPQWLEEGFANHLGRAHPVNYQWLKSQPLPGDVTQLTHPFKQSQVSIKYHYMASQALVEMLEKKCDMENLLRLSVGRKMSTYIDTYCGIKDINSAFKNWIEENVTSSKSDSTAKKPISSSPEKKENWWNSYMEKYKKKSE